MPTSHAVSGGVVFEMCVITAITVVVTQRLSSRQAMLTGLVLMVPTVALLVWAQEAVSLPLLLLGTTLAGISAGLGYRGSLQVVNQIAPPDRRAEVVSSYMLAGFAGNSLPIIGVGILAMPHRSHHRHHSFRLHDHAMRPGSFDHRCEARTSLSSCTVYAGTRAAVGSHSTFASGDGVSSE